MDFDRVEESNLASQGFLEVDLGRPKVEATAEQCCRINGQLAVHVVAERLRRSMDIGNVLFACVDQIRIRQLIWNAVKDKVGFFADGRMTAEIVRILVACDPASRSHYPSTLFAAAEARPGSCAAKTTIFTANIAAGMMIEQFTRWLRHLPVDADMQLNLLSSELTVSA